MKYIFVQFQYHQTLFFMFYNFPLFFSQVSISCQHFFLIFTHTPKINSAIISFKRNNCIIIKTYSFLHKIMAAITYFWLKCKIFIKKIPVMTNNALTQTIGFVNVNSLRHINPIIFEHLYKNIHLKKLAGNICSPDEKQP